MGVSRYDRNTGRFMRAPVCSSARFGTSRRKQTSNGCARDARLRKLHGASRRGQGRLCVCVWGGSSPVGRHGCDGQVRNMAHTRKRLAAAGTHAWTQLSACVALEVRVRPQSACCVQRESDRKPKVPMLCRSSYSRNLLVVKRSTAMPRSSFLMPHPLSVICTAHRPHVSAPLASRPASGAFSRARPGAARPGAA